MTTGAQAVIVGGGSHGRLARLAPDQARVARRRAPGEERAHRGFDLARGRALPPTSRTTPPSWRCGRPRCACTGTCCLPAETGESAGFHPCGALRVTRSAERMAEFRHVQGLGRFMGYELRILTPEALARIYPLAHVDGLLGAIHEPDDGHVDPTLATQAPRRGGALARRRDPAPHAGAGDRARRLGRVGGAYRSGHRPLPARGQRGGDLVPGDRRDDGCGAAGNAHAAPVPWSPPGSRRSPGAPPPASRSCRSSATRRRAGICARSATGSSSAPTKRTAAPGPWTVCRPNSAWSSCRRSWTGSSPSPRWPWSGCRRWRGPASGPSCTARSRSRRTRTRSSGRPSGSTTPGC